MEYAIRVVVEDLLEGQALQQRLHAVLPTQQASCNTIRNNMCFLLPRNIEQIIKNVKI